LIEPDNLVQEIACGDICVESIPTCIGRFYMLYKITEEGDPPRRRNEKATGILQTFENRKQTIIYGPIVLVHEDRDCVLSDWHMLNTLAAAKEGFMSIDEPLEDNGADVLQHFKNAERTQKMLRFGTSV
jgi:hypothetical protein